MPDVLMNATARFTFDTAVAAQRASAARDLVSGLGADVRGSAGLILTGQDTAQAARHSGSGADLVIHVCASFSDASPALALYGGLTQPVLLWALREPGQPGDRLWLNSLCGANLAGHALVHAGRSVRLLHADPGEPQARTVVADALRGTLPPAVTLGDPGRERAGAGAAQRAVAALRGSVIGLAGEAPAGFTPSELDPSLLDLLGLRVRQLSTEQIFGRVAAADPGQQQAELQAAAAAQPSLAGVDPEQAGRAAATAVALRDWTRSDSLAAVAVRCWPEFPEQLGVCPCSALSRLADDGTATACERDVLGAATMLLAQALGSGPTYLADTVDLDAGANLIRVWHCGSAATSLAADPAHATQTVHCNRRIGVAGNFPLRTGPVVMTRLDRDPVTGGLRLLITSGQSVPEPNRFQGNSAAIAMDGDAAQYVHALVTGGFPHHTVLAWSDVRPGLRAVADLLHIPVSEC